MNQHITVSIALTAANFLYQAITFGDWDAACERSWFQITALFAVWWYGRMKRHLQPQPNL